MMHLYIIGSNNSLSSLLHTRRYLYFSVYTLFIWTCFRRCSYGCLPCWIRSHWKGLKKVTILSIILYVIIQYYVTNVWFYGWMKRAQIALLFSFHVHFNYKYILFLVIWAVSFLNDSLDVFLFEDAGTWCLHGGDKIQFCRPCGKYRCQLLWYIIWRVAGTGKEGFVLVCSQLRPQSCNFSYWMLVGNKNNFICRQRKGRYKPCLGW